MNDRGLERLFLGMGNNFLSSVFGPFVEFIKFLSGRYQLVLVTNWLVQEADQFSVCSFEVVNVQSCMSIPPRID